MANFWSKNSTLSFLQPLTFVEIPEIMIFIQLYKYYTVEDPQTLYKTDSFSNLETFPQFACISL